MWQEGMWKFYNTNKKLWFLKRIFIKKLFRHALIAKVEECKQEKKFVEGKKFFVF